MEDEIKTDAILLLNLGGPSCNDEVQPFLIELFDDLLPKWLPFKKKIASKLACLRAPISKSYYEKIGGSSPLRKHTEAQASKLQERVKKPVNVVMRYSAPRANRVLEALAGSRAQRLLLLPLYPQYSRFTTQSSIDEIKALSRHLQFTSIEVVPYWYSEQSYLSFLTAQIEKFLSGENLEKIRTYLLFSAHGLPQKYILQGDPYLSQTTETVTKVATLLGLTSDQYGLGFQSKMGKGRWLEPSTLQCVEVLGKQGAWEDVVVVPVSFVSDHVETLYELDILVKEKAQRCGNYRYHRLPMFNDSDEFIDVLEDVVKNAPRTRLL
ncbi:MAG: ferrochelatase [Deltaproteobacteria bacterium]|nr:ferrochelatase [Deltaproteobacteria bacterium]